MMRNSQMAQSFAKLSSYHDARKTVMMPDTLIENEKLETRLLAHPVLKSMEPHHIETLIKSAELKWFEAGQVIFRTGEPAIGFYLIETGEVVIEATKHRQTPIAIDTVAAGEPLGWSWLFEPYAWEFDARATESTTAIFFSREHLWQHHEEDLTLGHELFKRMSAVMVRRLQAAQRKLIPEQKS
jgi:CRP/FNR family cyclic AMP-dependent transcriptional regulator